MTNFQFITTIVILAVVVATVLFLYWRKTIKDNLVELNCKFCISDNTDQLLDTYYEQTGVHIDGILGNDFLVKNDYIIDYKNLILKHNTKKISIKDAMDIVEIPLLVLYQGWRKYIFIVDTGATTSLIHSKHTNDMMKFVELENEEYELYGYGGHGESSRMISTSLYYSQKKLNDPI